VEAVLQHPRAHLAQVVAEPHHHLYLALRVEAVYLIQSLAQPLFTPVAVAVVAGMPAVMVALAVQVAAVQVEPLRRKPEPTDLPTLVEVAAVALNQTSLQDTADLA
jgi:hypothetical protein